MSDCSGSCGDCNSYGNCDSEEKIPLADIKYKILIMSGKGGVGKSSVAAGLARSLAKAGKKVGLLDIDFHGPSIPTLFGLKDEKAGGSEKTIIPVEKENIKIMSIPFLIPESDSAVVWRGPMKSNVLKQLFEAVDWGSPEYLIMDFPPGTGDEALSACQFLKNPTGAIIVTTPQEVSLSDCRRCIDFCRKLELPVLGIIENMSGFICPECGTATEIFSTGGGLKLSQQQEIRFFGKIPLDPAFMNFCENGGNNTATENPVLTELDKISLELSQICDNNNNEKEKKMRIAIPCANEELCLHFGHCQEFFIADIDEKSKSITKKESLTPPPHAPGLLPKWLGENKVTLVIAGGMGGRAQDIFTQNNIKVITGAPTGKPEDIINDFLADKLETGTNTCDH